MEGARRVGRRHRVLQREGVERPALIFKRLHIAKAEGDQRAACRGWWIERDGGAGVMPEDGLPPRHAILGKIVLGEISAAALLFLTMAWPTSPSRNSLAPSSASHSKGSPRSGLRKVSPDLSNVPSGAKIFAAPGV